MATVPVGTQLSHGTLQPSKATTSERFRDFREKIDFLLLGVLRDNTGIKVSKNRSSDFFSRQTISQEFGNKK